MNKPHNRTIQKLGQQTASNCQPNAQGVAATSVPQQSRESGIALFVVMVVILILSILIYQMSFTSKVEEVISRNRKGFTKASYSLQSVAREMIMILKQDWIKDLEEAADSGGEEAGADGGPLSGMIPDGAGSGTGDGATDGDATANASDEIDTDKGFDYRREDWEVLLQKSLNEIEVEVDIQDCESKININFLFNYVNLKPIDELEGAAAPGATAPDTNSETDSDADSDEAGPNEEEVEEWIEPSEEAQEAAVELFIRLIDGVIEYNREAGFDYEVDLPNSRLMAEDSVNLILGLLEENRGKALRRVDFLEDRTSAVWWPPIDPRVADEEEARRNGELGSDEEITSSFGVDADLDGDSFDDSSGWRESADGFERVPKPIGLKDLVTVFGGFKEVDQAVEGGLSGEVEKQKIPRLNLNTTNPIVIAALLQSWDFDEATEFAQDIDIYLDTLADEEDADTSGDAAAVDPTASDSSSDESDEESDEDAELETPYFQQISDLDKINEDWTEGGVGGEPSVVAQLKHDLEKTANFRSQYFKVYFTGKVKAQKLHALMIVERIGKRVRPLVWREYTE